jgi:hypothetical protein
MYFKEQRYEKAKASTFAATHTVEMPDTGLIDSMSLYFRAQNSSDPSTAAPGNIHHNISKIEVIGDNDKTLFSLSGEQALAKAFRKMGALPPFKQNEYGLKSQDLLIPIFFGRKFKDGKYALDLSKWDKVELKVTNTFLTPPFVAASLNMETRLCTLEDSVEGHPKFLKQWEYEATAPSVALDTKFIKLPTKGNLRSMMIQLDPTVSASTGAMTADPAGDSYNWKLWFKDRALTVFDHRPRDMMRDEHRRIGIGQSCCKPYQSLTRYTDFHWAEVVSVAIGSIDESGTIKTPPNIADQRDRYQVVANVGTNTFYNATIQGVGLFHTFEIPWHVTDEEAEYLNLEQYKPVEIEWYTYNIYHTHRLILEKPIGQGPSEFA